jgi:AAA+ superfamily predicted ATPase
MVNFNVSANPVLDAIEAIFNASESSGFHTDKLESCKDEIRIVSEFFNADNQQAVVLAALLGLHFNGDDTNMKVLLNHARLKLSASIYIQELLKPFIEAEWIRTQASSRYHPLANFTISTQLLNCVMAKNWNKMGKKPCQTSFDVLKEFGKSLKERRAREISYDKLVEKAESLLQTSDSTPICEFTKGKNLDSFSKAMFLTMCYNHVSGSESFNVDSLLNELRPNLEDQFKIRQGFKHQKGPVFQLELIEVSSDASISFSDNDYRLSEKGIQAFLPDYSNSKKKSTSNFLEIIESEKIASKELYYNENERKKIKNLFTILKQENYTILCERLLKKGKPQCITAIFYGAPGTGKTETALQLAKSSGRGVLVADVSALRSKWVGETEKFTKRLFSDYEKMRKEHELCPILLFNEADSILSKRRPVTDKVDQMENAMQNIILQELEKFEGIFIATTNLEQNLDEAYDRRITFKIKYSSPSEEARLSIWKQKMPTTNEGILKTLNQKYKLTGGQIENICKKIEVDTLLQGDDIIDLDYLEVLAEEENSLRKKEGGTTIGFRMQQCEN